MLRRSQQGLRLLQREALRRPPAAALRRLHQSRDVAANKVVSLSVPDRSLQRVPGDLQRPGGVAGRELVEPQPDIARTQDAQWPGPDRVKQRPQQPFVQGARPLGRAVQALAQPVVDRLPHRVGARGPNSGVHFLVQRLKLGSVLPETFRRIRFPSGPYPSETAPMYRFLAASKWIPSSTNPRLSDLIQCESSRAG